MNEVAELFLTSIGLGPIVNKKNMTAEQRVNIGRGVKYAAMRKRQSEAMKASWVRRRANGATNPQPTKRASLREIADLLGIDTDKLIRDAIMARIA